MSQAINISLIEKKVARWAVLNRYNILLFCLLLFIAIFSPSLPYLNLYLSKNIAIFFAVASFMVVFNINIKYIFLLVVFLFLVAMLFLFLGESESAELLGNYVYGFLFIGVLQYLFKVGRKE